MSLAIDFSSFTKIFIFFQWIQYNDSEYIASQLLIPSIQPKPLYLPVQVEFRIPTFHPFLRLKVRFQHISQFIIGL